MSASMIELGPTGPEALARRFLDSLRGGRLVDALETLSPDAVVSDGASPDRHGLREIAASLMPYRTPDRFLPERVETHGNTVSASVRIPESPGKPARRYRARIEVRGGRIRTVRFLPD
jgi:hypothetical protein